MTNVLRQAYQREFWDVGSLLGPGRSAEQEQLKRKVQQFHAPLLILIQDLDNPGHVGVKHWEQPGQEQRRGNTYSVYPFDHCTVCLCVRGRVCECVCVCVCVQSCMVK